MNKTIMSFLTVWLLLSWSFVGIFVFGPEDDMRVSAVITGAAPNFTLTDIDGNEFTLSDYLGKAIIINFMATWAFPCKVQMDDLNEVYDDVGDQIVLISIDIDLSETNQMLRDFKDTYGGDWIFAIDTLGEDVTGQYDASSIPTNYIINLTGGISFSQVGVTDYDTFMNELNNTGGIKRRVHNIATGEDFYKIQDAIDDSNTTDGNTIYVEAGTYYEHVIVNKTINLTGEDMSATIIHGGGGGTVIKIEANWVNVSGFSVINGFSGIILWSSSNIRIANNNISFNSFAIRIAFSENDSITNNEMNDYGIEIIGTKLQQWNTHIIDTSNTVNGKPVYYSKNQNGGIVPSDVGQVILANCTGIIVENQNFSMTATAVGLGFSSNNSILSNNFSLNFRGIYLSYSTGNNIRGNVHSFDGFGVYLHYSNDNIISINTISQGNGYGVFVYYSDGNNIYGNSISDASLGIALRFSVGNNVTNNTLSYGQEGIELALASGNNIIANTIISNTDYGIQISMNSPNNVIYHNNFINNIDQALDYSNNVSQWDNGYPSGGNYWSDYSGSDDLNGPNQDIAGSDGIGDINYTIAGGSNIDNYPLMDPLGWTPSPTIDEVRITYNPDGLEVDDVLLDVGMDITFYASGYNDSSGYVGLLNVDWSQSPNSAGTFDIIFGSSTTFSAGFMEDTTSIIASNTTLSISDSFVLSLNAPTIDSIQIRNETANQGIDVITDEFTLGEIVTKNYYCAGYNKTAGYIGDVTADWSLDTVIGTINPFTGTITLFTATTEGTGNLTAKYFGKLDTLIITINPEVDLTAPAAPTGVLVSPDTLEGFLIITWNSNTEVDLAGYNIYRSDSAAGPFTKLNSVLIIDTSYSDSGLGNETTYYYRITALDIVPNMSDFSNTVSGTTSASPGEVDDDGLPNDWEIEHFDNLDEGPNDDFDNDGFSNLEEYLVGSDPRDSQKTPMDTDSDGFLDTWEQYYFGNLNQSADGDFDEDGFTNIQEYQGVTDPNDDNDYPGRIKSKSEEEDFGSSIWMIILIIIFAAVALIETILILKKQEPGFKELQENERIEDELETDEILEDEVENNENI